METSLQLTVNGTSRQIAAGSTVADLVRELGLKPEQVAVERNKQIVRRADHAATELGDGDQLEVVTFFGGG
ncbi:MAG: sulfur carrier protein ThiS [Planctomycetota bacterium]